MIELWRIGLCIASIIVGSFGPIYLKRGTKKLNRKDIWRNWEIPAGCAFYVGGVSLFIPALRGGQLSLLYPILSLSYAWVCFLSTKLLGEKMNKNKWIGVMFIVVGVGLIGLGN